MREELKSDQNIKGLIKHSKFLFCVIAFVFLTTSLTKGQSSQIKAGLTYSNIPIVGSTSSWTALTNAISSNDVYAVPVANLPSSGNFTDYLKITNFQFSIPVGSIVTGIQISVERSDANGKSKDFQVLTVKNGVIQTTNKSNNSAWKSSDAVEQYGADGDLWGLTWSSAEINSASFGFAFAAQRTGGGGQSTMAKIDDVSIKVFYTSPLPIDLVHFTTKKNGSEVDLSWTTASEINNDYFTIERSSDGEMFTSILSQPGSGNTTTITDYSDIDLSPLSGYSFYRLKQTDYDGQTSYSEIETVKFSTDEDSESSLKLMSVSPNPFSDNFTSSFILKSGKPVDIKLLNASGHVVAEDKIETKDGMNQFQFIDSKNLNPGIYFLVLIQDDQKITSKVVKL